MGVLDEALFGRPIGLSRPPEQTFPVAGTPPKTSPVARPLTVDCDYMDVGNDTYASNIRLCLDSLTVDGGDVTVDLSVTNRATAGSGFYFDPRVVVRVDGTDETTFDIYLGRDTTESRSHTINGLSDGNHTIEVAVVGDHNSGCWCTGRDEISCDVSSPSGDCMKASGTVSVSTFDPSAVTTVPDSCFVSPRDISPDEDVSLDVTVKNENGVDATAELTLTANGTGIATKTITVPANGQKDATFSFTPDEVGIGTLDTYDLLATVTAASRA